MATLRTPPNTHRVRDHKGIYRTIETETLIDAARQAAKAFFADGPSFNRPDDATAYLRAVIGHLEHEVFCAVWLNNQNAVLRFDELFRGTIAGASVYPREVVKTALAVNAAAVIFAHNHPGGDPEPGEADIRITGRLREALELVEVRTLDHIVIGTENSVSLAKRGLL